MQGTTDWLIDHKQHDIQSILSKWTHKFPLIFDESVFKEKDRIISFMERPFIEQRSARHMAKLACKICFARKRLANNSTVSFTKDYVDIQVVPMVVQFPLGSRTTLGILTHANLRNDYERYNKNQVLNVVQRLFSDVQVVSDSIYEIQPPRSTIQTVYFEISKQNGESFSLKEIHLLKDFLKLELPYSIEKLTSTLFVMRNEEEVCKNIFILSKEIQRLSDPPQVMIVLEQQTPTVVDLFVILVYVRKGNTPSLKEIIPARLTQTEELVECRIERWETVRYMQKRHPVEAGIIKLCIDKRYFPRRNDGGLHFHLVRQKVSQMLTSAIGSFRDYNGGLMIQQMERFSALKEAFPEESQDLLENFYYSLKPLEFQAMLSVRYLKALFEAFLIAKKAELRYPTDFFMQMALIRNTLFISIRVPDQHFSLNSSVFTSKDLGNMVCCTITDHGSCHGGYLISQTDRATKDRLKTAITNELSRWKDSFKQRKVLRLNFFNPVVSLDPRIGGDNNSSTVLKLLFEGLMRRGRSGELELGVAQSVSISEDQKTYTFTLKETLWSNGTPVTARDFEYAWKTILTPSFKTSFAYLLYPIKNARLAKNGSVSLDEVGIHAIDDTTLLVELEFPTPYFLESTALTVYSPISFIHDQQHPSWPQQEGSGYICNGAFYLACNKLNEQHSFAKNPLYWDHNSIRLNEIIVLKANLQAPFAMFHKGVVDWVGVQHIKTTPFREIVKEKDEIVALKNSGVYWVVFNTTQFPFHNKKLRQALAMGINRSRLQSLFDVTPAISPIPIQHSQIRDPMLSNYSLELARTRFEEALQELNISREEFPPIQIIHLQKAPHPQVMTFIQKEWKQAFGIHCELKIRTWARIFSELSELEFQVGGTIWEAWVDDPIYTLNSLTEGGLNFPKWKHRTYTQTIHEAEKETNAHNRKEQYARAEKILIEEMPIAPIFCTSSFAIKKKDMQINCPSSFLSFKWSYFI